MEIYRSEGVELHWRAEGEGRNIVFLHGLGCSHSMMADCMEPVFSRRPGYRRVYVDLPGMGESAAPLSAASADAIGRVLLSFLEREVEGRFLLCGYSYGGYLARGLLTRTAGRVDGLMLWCPAVVPEAAERRLPSEPLPRLDTHELDGVPGEEKARYLHHAIVLDKRSFRRFKAEVEPALLAQDQEFIEELKAHYAFGYDVDGESRALGYGGPVLLLNGRQDNCVGYADQLRMLDDYPRATWAVLDMAGHNLQLDQPEVFECLVEDWLRRVEAL